MDELLTTQELADRLGTKTDAIFYLIRTGRIPPGKRTGQCYVWTTRQADQIQQWLRMREKMVFVEEV